MPDPGNPLDSLSPEATPVQPQGQGQPAPAAPEVQPAGQGQEGDTTGLYDLSTVPEEYRSEVERIAKDIDRNVQSKLREHADFRKQWEPFAETGLQDYDPEGVGALLQFAQLLGDPEKAPQAIRDLAESLEIDLTPEQQLEQQQEVDPQDEVRQKLAELEAWKQAREEEEATQRYVQEAEQAYRAEYAEVEAQHGKPFSEEEKGRLIDLAKRFQADHEEPIKAAYTFLTEVKGSAEAELVKSQPAPPKRAEPAGRASTTVDPVDDFDEALRLHRERSRTVTA